jgi:Mg-chelatase subunit ChlD
MGLYTFSNERLSFEKATHRHATTAEIVTDISNRFKGEERVEIINRLQEIWDSLVGIIELDDKGVLSDCIDWTIPNKHVSIMHLGDCMPATFAFKSIVEQFGQDNIDIRNGDDVMIRESLRKAWKLFEQRRLEANYVEEGFGCDDSVGWHTLRDILDHDGTPKLQQDMIEIAKLAGRMFDSFRYVKSQVESDDPQSIKGSTIGGDIERLIPEEMAKLSIDETKTITSMKVLKKESQQFHMTGLRSKTRGPLVLAIDESGSMHDYGVGYRGNNCWAKACAVALTRIAWSENRPVRVVHFDTSTLIQEVPKDDHFAMFEMARSFLSGGTKFPLALNVAYQQVGDLESNGFKGADVLIITDGCDSSYDQQNAIIDKLDKDGIKLWSITVANELGDNHPIKARAEKYINVREGNLGSGLESGIDDDIIDGLQESALADPHEVN